MWGVSPKESEISEHTCLAVSALLDPVPQSSAMLRGQGSAHTGGFLQSAFTQLEQGHSRKCWWSWMLCLSSWKERCFLPRFIGKAEKCGCSHKVPTQGWRSAPKGVLEHTLAWQLSLLWDRNNSVLALQPPTTTPTLPLGPACPNNSVLTPPSTHPSTTTHFSQVNGKCNLCVLYLSLIDQADVFLFWTNSHYIWKFMAWLWS